MNIPYDLCEEEGDDSYVMGCEGGCAIEDETIEDEEFEGEMVVEMIDDEMVEDERTDDEYEMSCCCGEIDD